MSLPFNNQVVLITGAASGLGRQLALLMARQGAVIAAIDLQLEPLEKLMGELKAQNSAGGWELGDVTDRAGLVQAVERLEQRIGPIQILVANAGIGIETSALSFRAADIEKQINVNLLGVVNSIEAVLPRMLSRGHGQIVAISSLASYHGVPRMAGYCASKAGVSAVMDSIRVELRPRGIHCTTICPGWIRTPLTDSLPDPKPKMLTVEDAARRIVKAIQGRRRYNAFPFETLAMVRLLRWLPTSVGDWMVKHLLPRLPTGR
jgi:NAD(P)-dependent dehydrogenase (short-subunit alcohol dehydrogenase family)